MFGQHHSVIDKERIVRAAAAVFVVVGHDFASRVIIYSMLYTYIYRAPPAFDMATQGASAAAAATELGSQMVLDFIVQYQQQPFSFITKAKTTTTMTGAVMPQSYEVCTDWENNIVSLYKENKESLFLDRSSFFALYKNLVHIGNTRLVFITKWQGSPFFK